MSKLLIAIFMPFKFLSLLFLHINSHSLLLLQPWLNLLRQWYKALFFYFYTALDASNKYCIPLDKPMQELSEMTQLVLTDDWTVVQGLCFREIFCCQE